MIQIDHIVFDVGRVLIRWDHELVYLNLIPDMAERQAFLDIITPWNAEQDRGTRSWAQAEAELIDQYPGKEDWIRAYRRDWEKGVPGHFEETVEIMRSLIATGHDVTLLTNFSDDTWPLAVARFPFLNEPRGVTVSAEVKLIKPEAGIFIRHAETFDLTPERTLFFDDSPANVGGAREAGWQGELYEGDMGGNALVEILKRYDLQSQGHGNEKST